MLKKDLYVYENLEDFMKLTKKIMKCNKKVVSVLLSLAILLTVFSIPVVSAVTTDVKESKASSTAVSSSANQYGLQDNIQDGTMLHCFNWKYTDIKAEQIGRAHV